MRRYVSCPKCGHRNDRTGGRRLCVECRAPLPKRKVAGHAKTLRDDSYATYVQVARDIHSVTDESCCVCGKPRSQERKHDRDHDHKTGRPRGLACGGNQGCNVMMLPWITPNMAIAIASEFHADGDEPLSQRWLLIHDYLVRVRNFYAAKSIVDDFHAEVEKGSWARDLQP